VKILEGGCPDLLIPPFETAVPEYSLNEAKYFHFLRG
jgi:hypothetical protein